MKLPLLAKKPKLQGDPIDYLDFDFYQVVPLGKDKRRIVDVGYVYEISPGLYGCVQYIGLWLEPKLIRSEGWEYYDRMRDGTYRSLSDLDDDAADSIIRKLAPGAKYMSMKEVTNDTPPGMYYMNVSDMMDEAYARANAEYEQYGYSDDVHEDTMAYLDDARMDEVSDSHMYRMNGKVANKLMAEKMWEDQKIYGQDRKPKLLKKLFQHR